MSLKRLIKSFTYAFKGLVKTWREEQNLQIHTVMAIITILIGFLFGLSSIEWLFLILCITLVVIMEVVNSAVERVTDILKPRIHGYVKEIKDIMAAAVLLASISAVIVGLIIFGPKFYALLVALA
ncbi:MAG: diacylglycerol kinase family protein [bacterium]